MSMHREITAMIAGRLEEIARSHLAPTLLLTAPPACMASPLDDVGCYPAVVRGDEGEGG